MSRCLSRFTFAAPAMLLLLTTASPVIASLTFADIYANQVNRQVGGGTVNPNGYFFNLEAFFTNPGDYSGVTVTYPGPGSPATLPASGNKGFGTSPSFATLGALHTAYPFGTYNYAIRAGTLPATTAQIVYSADSFETTGVPALTAATFNGLNGLQTSAPFNIAYNSFTPNTSNNGQEFGLSFFNITDPSNGFANVFGFNFQAPTFTGGVLPANTLLPNHTYSWELDFSDRLNGQNANGNFTELGSDVRTDGTFTTGAALPEPTTFGLICLGVVGLTIRRYASGSAIR